MIIKKKYTKIKKLIDEVPEEETLSVIDDVVRTYEEDNKENGLVENTDLNSNSENIISENPENIEENTVDEIENGNEEDDEDEITEPEILDEKRIKEIQDLDLTLQNIKFEQREERREGTRRRGYRRTQDRNIVTRAQQDAISIRESAKKEGYEEGMQEAQSDIENIRTKLESFFCSKEDVYNKVSGCILEISMEIAKKILNKEVEENREYIIPIIRGLLDDVNKTENKITLKVAPKDVEIVKDQVPQILAGQGFEAKISVIPDNTIQDGGVIIETSNGIVDASLDTQISIMEQVLKKPQEENE